VQASSDDTGQRKIVSAEWAPAEQVSQPRLRSIPLQSLATPQTGPIAPSIFTQDTPDPRGQPRGAEGSRQISGPLASLATPPRTPKRSYNYAALATALQTLGYSINGFIAAAVVTMEGQPIAQVTIDELDISRMCKNFSTILKGVLQSLDQGNWGEHEHIVITSADRHILMRVAGVERNAFQVLITTRETDPAESLEVMANIEGAISAALR
jgi:predicted regulator of Ras-like GTPase activity (Roadblock/LC7/MglB family)